MIKAEAPEIISRFFLFMHLASMSKARGAEIQLPNQHRIFQMLSRKRIIIDSNVEKIKQGCQHILLKNFNLPRDEATY